jgi:hypothetical protein
VEVLVPKQKEQGQKLEQAEGFIQRRDKMSISIHSQANAEKLARFIKKINTKKSSHIGYCGVEKAEILDTLLNDFSDIKLEDSFMVAYRDDRMVGAVGFDVDLEEKTAEVWALLLMKGKNGKTLPVHYGN